MLPSTPVSGSCGTSKVCPRPPPPGWLPSTPVSGSCGTLPRIHAAPVVVGFPQHRFQEVVARVGISPVRQKKSFPQHRFQEVVALGASSICHNRRRQLPSTPVSGSCGTIAGPSCRWRKPASLNTGFRKLWHIVGDPIASGGAGSFPQHRFQEVVAPSDLLGNFPVGKSLGRALHDCFSLLERKMIPSHCLPALSVLDKQFKTTTDSGLFTLTTIYSVGTLERQSKNTLQNGLSREMDDVS